MKQMSNTYSELVIVGSGPAGLSAAEEACRNNVCTTIIDMNKKFGGQFYSQLQDDAAVDESFLAKNDVDRNSIEGRIFIDRIKKTAANIISNATVWGIFPGNEIAYVKDGKTYKIKYEKLILAEGVVEKPLPFPGWTLPGVYTAGGAQKLLKTYRVRPGKKVLLAGSGPILLALACQLISAGVKIAAILETASFYDYVISMRPKHVVSAFQNHRIILEGVNYIYRIKKANVPIRLSHAIISAAGRNQVEKVTYARIDRHGVPIKGSEKEMEVDAVCIHHGFQSSNSLAKLAGCRHQYNETSQNIIPVHDSFMETDIDGIFVAGDMTSAEGRLTALEEGRIAAIRVSRQLGKISLAEETKRTEQAIRKILTYSFFSGYLNKVHAVKTGLYSRITTDTIICRCEELSAAHILNTSSIQRNINLNEIKKITRAGMGYCQGRTCSGIIASLVALKKGEKSEEIGRINSREPVYPIRIEEMIQND